MENVKEKNFSQILEEIKTKEDQLGVLEGLERLERGVYRSKTTEVSRELVRIPQRLASVLQEHLKFYLEKEDEKGTKEFLTELKQAVSGLRVLRLELAFEPTDKIIEDLNRWVRNNLGEGVVLEIVHEGSIGGGAQLIFEGQYRAFSLKKMLEGVLQKQRNTIFKRYLNI